VLSSRPNTVTVVLLAIALVGAALAVGGVAAIDAQDDGEMHNQTDSANETDLQQSAYLRAVHASPDAPAVDVLVNNETVLSNVSFGAVSDYLTLEAGTYNVSIAAAEDPDTVVFDGEVTLEPRSVTTLAASGEISEDANTSFEPVAFEDSALMPSENESALSIVHLAPDAPAVDVTAGNGSVVLADDVSFQNASEYVSVPAGNYTAEIRAATEGNNGSIVTTVDVSLEGGTAYSAFAVGYLNPDEAPADTPFHVVMTEDATKSIHLPSDDMGEMNGTNGTDGENGTDDGNGDNSTDDGNGDNSADDENSEDDAEE